MIPIGKLPNRWVWVIAALLFIQPLELWQYFSGHTLSIRGIEGDCTVKEAEARIRAQIDEYRANQECQEELVGAV